MEDISVPDIESIWLLLKPSRLPRGFKSIILAANYHPPRNDDRSLLSCIMMKSLDRVLVSNPGAAVILTGEFNQFEHRQLCNFFSLKQIVKRPTRGSNVLDKIFTNVSKFYNVPDVVPPVGFSDHNSILLMPLNHCKNSRTVRFIRDAHPANRHLIAEILSHINWSPMCHMNSCNDQFQYFSAVVNGIIEKYLPLKRMKLDSSDKPWISSEIKDLIPKRQAAWNSGNMDAFCFYRNKINTLCKSAHSKYYNVADSLQSSPHKWWSTVKNIAGLAPSNNISTVTYNGMSYSDSDLANLLNDKFVAVGNTFPPFTCTPLQNNLTALTFNILSGKLHRMGVHPVVINWIANFLTDQKQRTRIEKHYSSWKTINASVPQGTKLAPCFFLSW